MRLYITKTSISPMYNGEVGVSEVIKISRQACTKTRTRSRSRAGLPTHFYIFTEESGPVEETSQKSAAIAKLSDQKSKVSRTMRTTFKATTLQFTQFMNDMYNLTESAKISKNAA